MDEAAAWAHRRGSAGLLRDAPALRSGWQRMGEYRWGAAQRSVEQAMRYRAVSWLCGEGVARLL